MTPKEQRLLEQLREARADAQQLRTNITLEIEEAERARSERDRHLADVVELRNSLNHYVVELQKLRADAELVEAHLDPTRTPAPAEEPQGFLEPATDPRAESKHLQAQMMTQVAQTFRGSLTNILGYSKLLLRGADGELSPAQKTNVTNILDAGTRLVTLVNGLSDYVRLEAGLSEPRPTVVDLTASLTRITTESPRRPLAAVLVADALSVKADPRHLDQILRALVSDAPALDPEASGRLSATSSDGRVVVELVLTDFHTGPEEMRTLLDPLGGDGDSRPLDESRLRLALARSLAEANGGQLRIVPSGPADVAFVVELQAVPAEAA